MSGRISPLQDLQHSSSQDQLLPNGSEPDRTSMKNDASVEAYAPLEESSTRPTDADVPLEERNREVQHGGHTQYRVYKRRFFGLTQLVLLNIIVSWDVCSRSVSRD